MRIVLAMSRSDEDPELEEAARGTGASVRRVHDIEDAVKLARADEADAVLATAGEISRLSRGEEQISSYLRHRISNALTTVLGQAQLLQTLTDRDPESDERRLQAIVDQAIRIRDYLTETRPRDDAD